MGDPWDLWGLRSSDLSTTTPVWPPTWYTETVVTVYVCLDHELELT